MQENHSCVIPLPPGVQSPAKGRKKVFAAWDANGNGGLSLAEIDKGVAADYPEYDHKPALMRAYRWHKDSSAHMLCPYATHRRCC